MSVPTPSPTPPAGTAAAVNLNGLVIWLLAICVLARPVSQAFSARFEMQAFARIVPDIIKDPIWINYLALNITHLLVTITLAIFCFLLIVILKRPFAVHFAVAAMWLLWPMSIIVVRLLSTHFINNYFTAEQSAMLHRPLMPTLAVGTLIALGWTLYFLFAKRVKLVYGV